MRLRAQRIMGFVGLVGLAGLVVAGCSGGGDPIIAPKKDALTALTATISNSTLTVGGTATISPVPSKGDASASVSYDYVSSSPGIASVIASGVVTAVSPGAATITVTATGSGTCCTSNTKTATVSVTVSAPPPALTGALTVAPSPASVNVGSTVTLVPNPTRASAAVVVANSFVSSSPSTAQVDGAGVVSGIAPGQAVVTVTSTGSGAGFATTVQTAAVTINVAALVPALGILTLTTTNGTTVVMGNSTRIIPNANPAAGAVVAFTYVSGTPTTAQVASDGTITTIAPGTSTITVTATGTGTGLAATTRVTTILITVLSATCSFIDRALDFVATGSITATDCLFQGGPGIADYFRVFPVATATVVRLDALATGFTSVGVVAHSSTNPVSPLTFNGTTAAQGTFLLPPGTSFLGVISRAGVFGNYSTTATVLPEDVAACRTVVVFATVTTTQRLTAESCLPNTGTNRFDSFAILAPGRSCTIDMRLATGGTPPLITDPFLEAWRGDGTQKITENDDIATSNLESRITFNSCVDPVGNYIEIRARAFDPTEFGQYRLTITFSP